MPRPKATLPSVEFHLRLPITVAELIRAHLLATGRNKFGDTSNWFANAATKQIEREAKDAKR